MTDEMKEAKEQARAMYPRYDEASRLMAKLMTAGDTGGGHVYPAWRVHLQQICFLAEALEAAYSTPRSAD